MKRISIDHVIYDDKARGFRAKVTVMTAGQSRERLCFWPGPAGSDFTHITRGLANDALVRGS